MHQNSTDEVLFSKWLKFSEGIANVGFFSTSTAVFIFLYLTFGHVKTNYENYKRYMVVFSLLGFGLAAIEHAVKPVFHSYNHGFVMFSLAHPFGASSRLAFDLLLSYTGFYASTISFLTVQFFYRYIAIVHPKYVQLLFGGWMMLTWLAYSLLFGAQWTLGVMYFAVLVEWSISYMNPEIQSCYGKEIQEIAMCCVVAYDEHHNLRWWNLMCVLNMTLVMMIQYSAIIYFGVQMSVVMRKSVSMLSPVLWKLHVQFFRILVLQILVPTITLFMPVFILMYTPLLDFTMRFPSGVMLSAFSFFPAMDAIIVMYILSDYKNSIKRMVGQMAQTVQGAMHISSVSTSRVSNVADSVQ